MNILKTILNKKNLYQNKNPTKKMWDGKNNVI